MPESTKNPPPKTPSSKHPPSKNSSKNSSPKDSSSKASSSDGSKSSRRQAVDSVAERAHDIMCDLVNPSLNFELSDTDAMPLFSSQDYQEARTMAQDAMKSRAYLYPIRGLVYFLSNRALWAPFISQLGPYLVVSVAVTTVMFVFAYIPQLAILMFVNGPLAVFTTVLLIFSQSSSIVNAIARAWLIRETLLDTFDATLVSRNQSGIVSEGREIRSGSDPIQKLGAIHMSPFQRFTLTSVIRYILYLPLNFIPVVGTIMFIMLQGRNRGKVCHDRYFQLKTWSSAQKSRWMEAHAGSYTSFGIVAALLELIPIISMLFTYTNAVGAALWAADLEDHTSALTSETAPRLRQRAETAEKGD